MSDHEVEEWDRMYYDTPSFVPPHEFSAEQGSYYDSEQPDSWEEEYEQAEEAYPGDQRGMQAQPAQPPAAPPQQHSRPHGSSDPRAPSVGPHPHWSPPPQQQNPRPFTSPRPVPYFGGGVSFSGPGLSFDQVPAAPRAGNLSGLGEGRGAEASRPGGFWTGFAAGLAGVMLGLMIRDWVKNRRG